MSPPRGRLVGAGAAAVGALAAGTAAGLLTRRRLVGRMTRRWPPDGRAHELGSLRADPVTVIAADGVRLHAEVDEAPGAAGEPTLVFVHGYALNLDCWHFQRAHLRGRRRMVFYDQRSHGRSDRSAKASATVDQLGHDLCSVIDQLVPDGPVVLVGHSMGGMTLMALADHSPELFGSRVVGVGLVSTTAGGLRSHAMLPPLLPDRLMSQIAPRMVAGLARASGLVDSARRAGSDIGFLATGAFAFGTAVPSSYVDFVDRMLARTPFEVIAEFFPNFGTLDKYEVLHAFERVPTLVVCGTGDLLTSIDHSRKLALLIDGAELVECPKAGHMVLLECHEAVNAALDRLLDRAGGVAAASGAG